MRIRQTTRTTLVGRTARNSIEGIVLVQSIDARRNGRGFVFERQEPQAIVVRGEDELLRLDVPRSEFNVARVVLPVAAYAIARVLFRNRRQR
jgi:hypothetical protein